MPDILAMGEALVDMVAEQPGTLDQVPGFVMAAGGANANVAAAAARLGASSGFIGAVSGDPFGRFLLRALREAGVDVSRVPQVPVPTAVAFVSRTADGGRDFLFYPERPAHLALAPAHLDPGYLTSARVLQYGSLSMAAEPARQAHQEALRLARGAGVICSYDPNLRPGLWPSRDTMMAGVRTGLSSAHLLKVSAEELAELAGDDTMRAARQLCRDAGLALLVVSAGGEGAFFVNAAGEGHVAAHPVEVVDSTGAGDAFVAGLLVQLVEAGAGPGDLRAAAPDRVRTWLEFASRAGALACRRKGVFPALPTRAEVGNPDGT